VVSQSVTVDGSPTLRRKTFADFLTIPLHSSSARIPDQLTAPLCFIPSTCELPLPCHDIDHLRSMEKVGKIIGDERAIDVALSGLIVQRNEALKPQNIARCTLIRRRANEHAIGLQRTTYFGHLITDSAIPG